MPSSGPGFASQHPIVWHLQPVCGFDRNSRDATRSPIRHRARRRTGRTDGGLSAGATWPARHLVHSIARALAEHLGHESDPPAPSWAAIRAPGPCCVHSEFSRPTMLFAEARLGILLPDGRVARYPRSVSHCQLNNSSRSDVLRDYRAGERWKLLSWLEQFGKARSCSPPISNSAQRRSGSNRWPKVRRTSLQTIWNPLARWLTGNDIQSCPQMRSSRL